MKFDWLIDLRPCQHNNSYMDGRSKIKVHTEERTLLNFSDPVTEKLDSPVSRKLYFS